MLDPKRLLTFVKLIGQSLVSVLFFALVSLPAVGADITGKPRIIDGDTIVLAGQRIRLHGIDAPENRQTCTVDGKPWLCGKDATAALKRIIGASWVTCVERDIDRYKRIVAVCQASDVNLNAHMVRNGWALAYRGYSKDYVADEAAARRAGKGLWRGEFVPPWKWRRGKRGQ